MIFFETTPSHAGTRLFNRELFVRVLITSFVVSILAHGYCFFNTTYTHDGLDAIVSSWDNGQLMLKFLVGRITQPLYYACRGYIAMPLLLGCLAILWQAMASYFILSLFKISSKSWSVLFCSLLCTSASFTLTCASYIHECDSYGLAFMLASLAIWLSEKMKYGWCVAPFILVLALGLYQAFLGVSICLCMLLLVVSIAKGDHWGGVLKKGTKSLFVLLAGLFAYLIIVKVIWSFVDSGGVFYNTAAQSSMQSLDFATIFTKEKAYIRFFYRFFVPETYHVFAVGLVNLLIAIGSMKNVSKQIAIRTVLCYPMPFASEDVAHQYEDKEEVRQMPSFPQKGYCKMVEGKLVIKIADAVVVDEK